MSGSGSSGGASQGLFRLPRRARNPSLAAGDPTLMTGAVLSDPDSQALQFSSYTTDGLPPAPSVVDNGSKVAAWPTACDDKICDCAEAAAARMIELWTAAAGNPVQVTDAEVKAAYASVSGYDPATGGHDLGTPSDKLFGYWASTGIASHKLDYAPVMVDRHSDVHIRDCIYLFGACYLVLNLPATARQQYLAGNAWEIPPPGTPGAEAGTYGLHAVPAVGYDDAQVEVVTWGQFQRMSWSFLETYTREAWAVLSSDWIGANGTAASGFDLATLQNDQTTLGDS
jgi:hypothetical protein